MCTTVGYFERKEKDHVKISVDFTFTPFRLGYHLSTNSVEIPDDFPKRFKQPFGRFPNRDEFTFYVSSPGNKYQDI